MSDVLIVEPLDYDSLPTPTADLLRGAAAYIQVREKMTHQLIIEMGFKLIEVKQHLAEVEREGIFLAWLAAEVEFSASTAEHYMRVAIEFPIVPAGGAISPTALYLLSAKGTPTEARDIILELVRRGEDIDPDTGYIVSKAPDYLVQGFLRQELPKAQVKEATRLLRAAGTAPRVREVCQVERVTHPAVVAYLNEALALQNRALLVGEENPLFDEIARDHCLNGLGWSVALSQANERDVDRFKVDLAARKRSDYYADHFEVARVRVLIQEDSGSTWLEVVGDSAQLAGRSGEEVTCDVRVRQRDVKGVLP